jgi:hypothetical protein
VFRIEGPDRIATAVAVSKEMFPRDRTALAVVVARADQFSDGLVGAPLARRLGGPLLLTGGDRLDPRTAAEIDRLIGPTDTVVLLGGTSALGPLVEAEVLLRGRTPERIAGEDRFDTAVRVAERMDAGCCPILADGFSMPDALCAAGYAATWVSLQGKEGGRPLLLSAGSHMPERTRAYIASSRPAGYGLAIGPGPAAAAPDTYRRIVGRDRYETCLLVAQEDGPWPDGPTPSTEPAVKIGLASGRSGADALGGAVHIASKFGFLILVPPDELTPAIREYLRARKEGIDGGWVYGGPAAVASAVQQEASFLISGCYPRPDRFCPA